jgi:hypothetical protein
MFGSYTMLQKQFPEHPNLWDAMKKRFDGLPIHKTCYSQAYHPTIKTLKKLDHALAALDADTIDCFGLTPFHVLALSTKLDVHVWMALMQRCKADIAHQKDRWGCSPLYYSCVNNMINSAEVLRYVVQTRIENSLGSFALGKWKLELLNMTEMLSENMDIFVKMKSMDQIYRKLSWYVRLEKMSRLEQALWKARIDALPIVDRMDLKGRLNCRITSGVEVVASNVLPFLGKVEKMTW